MNKRHKVIVKINGRDYSIIGEEPESYIRGIGQYIDELIKEVLDKNSKLSESMATVLAAFTLADDLNKARKENSELELSIKEFDSYLDKSDELRTKIEKIESEKMLQRKEVEELKEIIKKQDMQLNEQSSKLEKFNQNKDQESSDLKIAQDKIYETENKYLQMKKELTEYMSRMKE